ncbi:MAG: hypothetical protein SPJ71_03945 [Candidatus Limisoma sp.]|nr:hypothetical protein [Bacteroidales bacterium]MDY5893710.1 hypothetical protein [Candidatus Limisoma sp.]MDD6140196.1 hypothetical protein [Bacteroidales bacterium]MDD6622113.1 hypothetical protein [Bacteroidales bacterium]MDD6668200.1 hypothetical protein [Bacteroidales bacterium]
MKKFCLLLILLLGAGLSVSAESTIRVFAKGFIDPDVRLFINGEEVCDLNGPINQEKKVKNFVYKEKGGMSENCFRSIRVNGIDKVTLKIVAAVPESKKIKELGKQKYFEAERTIVLSEGCTFNFEISMRSMTNHMINLPPEQDAYKWSKDWVELPEVTYPKE